MNLYRRACFDFKYRREVVPRNLRRFNVLIYIKEIRKFNTVFNTMDKLGALGIPSSKNVASTLFNDQGKGFNSFMRSDSFSTQKVVNENTANIMYTIRECEFMAHESSEVLSTVSNVDMQMTQQKLVINYQEVEEFSEYPLLDSILDELKTSSNDDKLSFTDKLKKKAAQIGKDIVKNAANSVLSRAENFAKAKINKLILGNVYGKGRKIIDALTNASIEGAIRELKPEAAVRDRASQLLAGNVFTDNIKPSINEDVVSVSNIFDTGRVANENNITIKNVFDNDQAPRVNDRLSATNILNSDIDPNVIDVLRSDNVYDDDSPPNVNNSLGATNIYE
jgi:hypothetical protein